MKAHLFLYFFLLKNKANIICARYIPEAHINNKQKKKSCKYTSFVCLSETVPEYDLYTIEK